ncbi:hypothetical protein DFS34DRAFT_67405 [Phlyctochytrium arcticum]|nr:hypothetical protein DFS34DRAFT_67405 [Phlyctochytrium arcticum]
MTLQTYTVFRHLLESIGINPESIPEHPTPDFMIRTLKAVKDVSPVALKETANMISLLQNLKRVTEVESRGTQVAPRLTNKPYPIDTKNISPNVPNFGNVPYSGLREQIFGQVKPEKIYPEVPPIPRTSPIKYPSPGMLDEVPVSGVGGSPMNTSPWSSPKSQQRSQRSSPVIDVGVTSPPRNNSPRSASTRNSPLLQRPSPVTTTPTERNIRAGIFGENPTNRKSPVTDLPNLNENLRRSSRQSQAPDRLSYDENFQQTLSRNSTTRTSPVTNVPIMDEAPPRRSGRKRQAPEKLSYDKKFKQTSSRL